MEKLLSTNIFSAGNVERVKLGLQQAFDLLQPIHLLGRNDTDRNAAVSGAAGSTAAMRVYFRIIGQFIIDHMRDPFHIDPTGRYVGGHQ